MARIFDVNTDDVSWIEQIRKENAAFLHGGVPSFVTLQLGSGDAVSGIPCGILRAHVESKPTSLETTNQTTAMEYQEYSGPKATNLASMIDCFIHCVKHKQRLVEFPHSWLVQLREFWARACQFPFPAELSCESLRARFNANVVACNTVPTTEEIARLEDDPKDVVPEALYGMVVAVANNTSPLVELGPWCLLLDLSGPGERSGYAMKRANVLYGDVRKNRPYGGQPVARHFILRTDMSGFIADLQEILNKDAVAREQRKRKVIVSSPDLLPTSIWRVLRRELREAIAADLRESSPSPFNLATMFKQQASAVPRECFSGDVKLSGRLFLLLKQCLKLRKTVVGSTQVDRTGDSNPFVMVLDDAKESLQQQSDKFIAWTKEIDRPSAETLRWLFDYSWDKIRKIAQMLHSGKFLDDSRNNLVTAYNVYVRKCRYAVEKAQACGAKGIVPEGFVVPKVVFRTIAADLAAHYRMYGGKFRGLHETQLKYIEEMMRLYPLLPPKLQSQLDLEPKQWQSWNYEKLWDHNTEKALKLLHYEGYEFVLDQMHKYVRKDQDQAGTS